MIQDDSHDAADEYRRAEAELVAYWKRIREGRDDDPAVALARLIQKFGIITIEAALQEYIDNIPSNFERRWKERNEALAEGVRRLRNPRRAGRRRTHSDEVLMAAWLLVQKCMSTKGLNAKEACELLAKPPTRRGANLWPGILLHYDRTQSDPKARSYYVKTPGNLRDVYNEAVAMYKGGPEALRRHWDATLEKVAWESILARITPSRVGNSHRS